MKDFAGGRGDNDCQGKSACAFVLRQCKMPMLASASTVCTAKRAADGGGRSGEQGNALGVECDSLATDGDEDEKEYRG